MKNTTKLAALVGALGLALPLAACASDSADTSASGENGTDTATESADSGNYSGEIEVWAWEPTLESVAKKFEEENPNVKINLVNAGTGNDQYVALQNAVSAGSGIPDIAQVEYYALPQFYIGGSLKDIAGMGASELEGTFSPGPWGTVKSNDAIYGLPMDSGPMALFYNEEVFKANNVEVPKTWDEYLEAARTLKKAGIYMANDAGDAGFTTSMIWQADGRPYKVDGTDVTINFEDKGSKDFAELWQKMIDEELIASTISSWSDEWYQGLGDGSIATLTIGAWMPANLESGVPDGEGKWRVADMPQWGDGFKTSENGGSSLAVMEGTKDADLAYAFLKYATAGDGVQIRVDEGAFPATLAELDSEEFLNKEFPYFGGQKANEVLSKSAKAVGEGWQYLPFQVYANSIFNDTVGKAYIGQGTLAEGLKTWQDQSVTYGNEQGFSVNK